MSTVETRSSGRDVAANELLDRLEAKVDAVVARVDAGPYMQALGAEPANPELPRAVMRETYFEIWSYHHHIFEAAAAAIGRIPENHGALIAGLFRHLADEAGHGDLAYDGYLSLGGDAQARQRGMSPGAFAIASMWWGLTHMADPFAYLGAIYLFEDATPKIGGRMIRRLLEAGLTKEQLAWLINHEHQDTVHSADLRKLIVMAVENEPRAAAAIEYGLDCAAQVFPGMLMDTVLARVGVCKTCM